MGMNMVGYDETLALAQEVASYINKTVPDFDMLEPNPAAAIRTKRGNCFARAQIAVTALEDSGIEHYLQIARKKPAGLRYRHSQIIIPILRSINWGVVIDTTERSTEQHTFARGSYADSSNQTPNLIDLRGGQTVLMPDDFGGHLRRPIEMQTFQPLPGIQRYQEIENIRPR